MRYRFQKEDTVLDKDKNDLPVYLFHQGNNRCAYEFFGCHAEGDETVFRVWAPNACRAYLVGDFNSWDDSLEMSKLTQSGIWEMRMPRRFDNDKKIKYKYKFINGSRCVYKADPYAVHNGTLGETASYVYTMGSYDWSDECWLASRAEQYKKHSLDHPLNIYEVHLPSFMRHSDNSYLNYRELAHELAPYVKQLGYTHVELLPLSEHPFDGSWGYQVTGFYSPTSRLGTPDDFKYFVDTLHSYGLGVIMDWVPAHFLKDEHGLIEFDGGYCYEYQGADRMEHKVWGTRFFDVGRGEVQSFLISNACYWLSEYHIDGLRCDAVASMLYLDYDRMPGEWIPAPDGSNRNPEAIAFFKKLNSFIAEQYPDVMMIAEESTDWAMLTTPPSEGGLGFTYKWNMGWMNDIIKYLNTDPLYRSYHHNALTFPLMYCFNENYILSISHDEVVHGKGSLINKCFGDYDMKFSTYRAFYAYMMTTPGKKLLFMGCEYAQFSEWDSEKSLEWFMTDFPRHNDFRKFVAELNGYYLSHPTLWQLDRTYDGFEWIRVDDAADNVIIYTRKANNGTFCLVVCNFSAVDYYDFRFGVPHSGVYREVINTDDERFSGRGRTNGSIASEPINADGREDSISITLPSLSSCIFELQSDALLGLEDDSNIIE